MTPIGDIMIFGLQLYWRRVAGSHYKPRTTDLSPWLWGAALGGSLEHSSLRSCTGRSVVWGKQVFIAA